MREYRTQNGGKIRKIGRAKKIYFTNNGAYFVWNGRRQSLEDIPRLTYPVFFENEDGKTDFCGGYITICNTYGVLVQLDEYCETAQLFEEVEA